MLQKPYIASSDTLSASRNGLDPLGTGFMSDWSCSDLDDRLDPVVQALPPPARRSTTAPMQTHNWHIQSSYVRSMHNPLAC